jgi:hypothetical protein
MFRHGLRDMLPAPYTDSYITHHPRMGNRHNA